MTRVLLFCLLFSGCHLFGQQRAIDSILNTATLDQLPSFDRFSLAEDEVAFEMGYSTSRFKKGQFGEPLADPIKEVRLVYTKFPDNNPMKQRALNRSRIRALAKQLPSVLTLPAASWKVVIQTDATTEQEAQQLFHGFVLVLDRSSDTPNFLDEEELRRLTEGDSTLFKVVERQKDWRDVVVVTDLTSSMAPYTAQLLLWFKLSDTKKMVKHFIFFNDGDLKTTSEKVIGRTGGIYGGAAESFEEAAKLAQITVASGYGGDLPENNLEALIYGIEACPDCKDVVMIADNRTSPRDMNLLSSVTKPIRLVLCGTEYGVNIDYLNIALKTGGSIHTIEEDIENLVEMNEGASVKIGDEVFIIKDGQFQFYKKI